MNMGRGSPLVCLHGRLTVPNFDANVGFSSDTHLKMGMRPIFSGCNSGID